MDTLNVALAQIAPVWFDREKTLVLRSIKELEFDHAMGKVSDQDFAEMGLRLRTRAAGLMRQLDAGASYSSQIEQELARRLAAAAPTDTESRAGRFCTQCGAATAARAKFCGQCGTALGAQGPVAGEGTVPPTAERRLVSVVFADLVGFTTLSESRDPEVVRDLLGRYFETATRIIESYGDGVPHTIYFDDYAIATF